VSKSFHFVCALLLSHENSKEISSLGKRKDGILSSGLSQLYRLPRQVLGCHDYEAAIENNVYSFQVRTHTILSHTTLYDSLQYSARYHNFLHKPPNNLSRI
jgi:hypothetical protein